MGSPPAGHPDVRNLTSVRLRQNPYDLDALFVLAAIRVSEGRFQESIEVLDRLVGLNPQYPGVWWLREKVYALSGAPEKAAQSRDRAVAEEG